MRPPGPTSRPGCGVARASCPCVPRPSRPWKVFVGPRRPPHAAGSPWAPLLLAGLVCCLAAVGCETKDRSASPTTARARGPVSSAPAAVSFFAATGSLGSADPVAAASQATAEALRCCRAAGLTPAAAIFLDLTARTPPGGAMKVGAAVKALAGAPTYGCGAAARADRGTGILPVRPTGVSPVDPAGSRAETPMPRHAGSPTAPSQPAGQGGVFVLVLAGAGLEVTGCATGGRIAHEAAGPPDAAKARTLRDACARRGEDLAAKVPPLSRPGFVLAMGAVGGEWHGLFYTAFRQRLGPAGAVVGGVGGWDDYVYCDGRALTDAAGRRTDVGQLAVVVQGDLRVACEAVAVSNAWDRAASAAEARQACGRMLRRLGPPGAGLVLSFGCVGAVDGAAPAGWADGLGALRAVVGVDVPLFGGCCGGQVGTDAEGRLVVGTGRFVICGLAGRESKQAAQSAARSAESTGRGG